MYLGFTIYGATYTPQCDISIPEISNIITSYIKSYFKAWANKRNIRDRFPSYLRFIVIDKETFQTLLGIPFSEDCSQSMQN
ncbi:hypothetical protein N7471_006156 [Penicillium samsonianum]|uniref:uncharacterized protein n=1 Tax=Penicillium samsonianum TaxID=1882272 RepID=UPI002546D191|nr:uncharacterized protein N7471_006156 [Penicillium samsonianum]KAJ6139670.1 hypothetical protein N7471_006156 [Penicillium samsonianum]